MQKIIVSYAVLGFILNFIWEVSQSGLYAPHFRGIREFMFVHLKAAIGDVTILLAIYFIVGLIYWEWKWIIKNNKFSYIIVLSLGLIFSIILEKYALVTGRWIYNDMMPLIPYVNVGIIPVLQLTSIAPLTLFLTKGYIVKGNINKREV